MVLLLAKTAPHPLAATIPANSRPSMRLGRWLGRAHLKFWILVPDQGMSGRDRGPDPHNGRCEGLNTDFAFGPQRRLLAALDDAIPAHTIGYPNQAGQAGNFQSPAFQGQNLVFPHLNTLWPAKHGLPEHDCRSFRIRFPFSKCNLDQESPIR
jgi:hypothetical protein